MLVHPDPVPAELAQALDQSGRRWTAVTSSEQADSAAPAQGWGGAIIGIDRNPASAWALCQTLRDQPIPVTAIVVLVSSQQIHELDGRDDLFDDFCLTPIDLRELERRLSHALHRSGLADSGQLIVYQDLVLNVDSYQATIAGQPLELTHMEYELLRYLAAKPGRVFTREVLLSQVWGYDYFGGARTVDVHIRRLRSKLGPDHAALIQTVRSVGYSLGTSSWSA